MKLPTLFAIFLLPVSVLWAAPAPPPVSPAPAAQALIGRLLPRHAGQFICEAIPSENGMDVYEVDSQAGKIVLRGSTGVAIASALNHYLKETAKCHVSWKCGDQLDLPDRLILPAAKTHVASPFKYRFAYNYCTHGYTMAWWDWPQWEQELDRLAIQGVNLALVIQGQEQVWINTLTNYGYSEADVRRWLVMPTYQPWQLMSNLEAFGGPVPRSLIRRRVVLGQKILARMRELGIEPVLQGYYGIVPSSMKEKRPQAKIHPQYTWCGLKRPDMLDPQDPLFSEMADTYHAEQEKLFGKVNFLAGDPFHEGGSTEQVDLAACGKIIYGSMQKAQPGVTWVLQSWQANPRQPMIDGLDKSKLLVLDLYCEAWENWRRRNAFGNTPWLWCTVFNFGGNTGLDSRLGVYARMPAAAYRDPAKGPMLGIGALMEGSHTAPAGWELFWETGWNIQPVADLKGWLFKYAERRYGAKSPAAETACEVFLRTVYSRPAGYHESPAGTVMNARPSLNPLQPARPCTDTRIPYVASELLPGWTALLAAAPDCGKSDAYRFDLADVTRQVFDDAGTELHKAIIKAYIAGDRKEVKRLAAIMLGMFDDLDAILATRQEFLFGAWIRDARAWGATPEESDLCEYNARMLLTLWEPTHGQLNNYASRSWSGLIEGYYKPQWEMWFAAMDAALAENRPLDVNATRGAIYKWEQGWVCQTAPGFSAKPSGDTIKVARRLHAKYLPILTSFYPKVHIPTAGTLAGRWRYQAAEGTFIREFRPNGTVQAYSDQGARLPWFDNFTWRIEGATIIMTNEPPIEEGGIHGDQVVATPKATGQIFTLRLRMLDANTLEFTTEGHRNGIRIAE
jgi:alpha-N-acetylglucosaminidase